MRKSLPKTPRVRLDAESYRQLQREVLARDRWRCQWCGSMQQLQVHHIQFRSQAGPDEEHNLITLCASCHNQLHRTGSRFGNLVT
jgi:5-methylcytosine-specific restriction endonuclease McrA